MIKDTWLSIRGAEMILSMKIISISFDLPQNVNKRDLINYLTSSSTSILGPWVSFRQYLASTGAKSLLVWQKEFHKI